MNNTSNTPNEGFPVDRRRLTRDGSFWAVVLTQYLGAFNDNVFKQLVLLICVDYVVQHNLVNDPFQAVATALFAVPFLMFSGLAGYLSDRNSKKHIVVLSKVAEIVVMTAGMFAFLLGTFGSAHLIALLMIVLCFMGTQSAFFGPSKYGILPEMLHEEDLPVANAVIQMTTFLAIILGIALAGVLKQFFDDRLWVISAVCIVIAVIGTVTSLMIRRTPVANAELQFSLSCLAIEKHAWRLIRSDRLLFWVLIIYALFWFAGGVVLTTVNFVGKNQLGIGDGPTSLLAASLAVGISIGCPISAAFSKRRVNFVLVTIGAAGLAIALFLASVIAVLDASPVTVAWIMGVDLLIAGLFAGIFAVPLQVFLQARPPTDLKGRIIGAMNFITWIGIVSASGFYWICSTGFPAIGLPTSWTFATLAIIMVAIAILFRPKM